MKKDWSTKPLENTEFYHDTITLLEMYRDAVWNLELAVQQVEHLFLIKYNNSIQEFLDSMYLAGADIGGTKLEDYAKSIEKSNQMLTLLNNAVELLKKKHKNGEQYYWILYYAYLSSQELQNTEEILEKLEPHIGNILYHTYYRKRPAAIEALSAVLWEYTSKNCINILNKFFQDKIE